MTLSASFKRSFQKRLFDWFNANQRDLPWRHTNDPYRIWVSEIMLQQTQVETVLKYYDRFISRFPDVETLGKASWNSVAKVWEGLGYYGRARNLHKTAKVITEEFDGRMPQNLDAWQSLPGVGRYTAGAVTSIAFNLPAPVLDGNVIRVFSRVFRITENVDQTGTKNHLWELAEALLPKTAIREHNEALMELGALICRPKRPDCPVCPLRRLCEARRHSVQDELPIRSPRKPIPHLDVTAGIIRKDNRFLITLRPLKGLLGGLWEFPGGKLEPGETLDACLIREIREELNIEIDVIRPLVSVDHAYTHFRITLHVFECRYRSGRMRLSGCDDYKWITPGELNDYAFPGADRKVMDRLKMKKDEREGRKKRQDEFGSSNWEE